MVGIFMTTADVRDVQTAMIWLAGSLQAATRCCWRWLFVSAARGHHPVPAARAADVALLGDRDRHRLLGVRLQQPALRFFCAGAADLWPASPRRSLGF